jgi:hypothetical protein
MEATTGILPEGAAPQATPNSDNKKRPETTLHRKKAWGDKNDLAIRSTKNEKRKTKNDFFSNSVASLKLSPDTYGTPLPP